MQLTLKVLFTILLSVSETWQTTAVQWTKWVTVLPCTEKCGKGIQLKIRHCPKEDACPGKGYIIEPCIDHTCPTHGEWSKYSPWTPCDKTCGGGYRTRTRTCDASNGGNDCKGSPNQTETCAHNACPVHGGWSKYSEWTKCDKSCGGGHRLRTRSCTDPQPQNGGSICKGLAVQTESCSEQPCQINGGWSEYGEWSHCDKSCGGGYRERKRFCNNPSPANGGRDCPGSPIQKFPCPTHPCPIHGGWSDYSQWSSCTKPCGGGTRSRTRSCTNPRPGHGGSSCHGLAVQQELCSTQPCPVHGGWNYYSDWSRCDKSCGGGTRSRTRSCTRPSPRHNGNDCPGLATQTVACSTQPCPVDGEWGGWGSWSHCDKLCGQGKRSRVRSCNRPTPKYGGKSCTGSSIQTAHCVLKPCPVHGGWSDYSEWTTCSTTCGLGSRKRSRTCNDPSPQHGGSTCSGLSYQTSSCYITTCPIPGGWSSWTKDGGCSTTCGKGVQHWKRSCNSPSPKYGGRDCQGSNTWTGSCCQHNCPATTYKSSYAHRNQRTHYKRCGFLWARTCVRHYSYSYSTRYRTHYLRGETC